MCIRDSPAVVRDRWNVERLARSKLDDRAIVERGGGGAGEHKSDVLDRAAGCPNSWPDVLGPFPPGLVRCAANRQPADVNDFELAIDEHAGLVRRLETLEDDQIH